MIPLDGQRGKGEKEFFLYLDQFYRFLLQSDHSISKFFVKVFKEGELVHEEGDCPSSPKYTVMGILFDQRWAPLYFLRPNLKGSLDLNYVSAMLAIQDVIPLLFIAQKGSDPNYQFSFSLEGEGALYRCDLLEPPPWQLDAIRKPSKHTPSRSTDKNTYSLTSTSKIEASTQLDDSFPLLDEFVDQLKKDPLALAGYVQNEIALVDSYCYREEGIFQTSSIRRNALRTYLEQQGSPWEQCQLLVYLLRRAGYKALYAMSPSCSLPKNFIENMLFTHLPEGEEEGFVHYPWVIFFDGEEWLSLFPWMKEMNIDEGFDLYHFLPEEFASADRWVLRYLKGDERILKHIGPDGDESAAVLFVAFVEEHLRKTRALFKRCRHPSHSDQKAVRLLYRVSFP